MRPSLVPRDLEEVEGQLSLLGATDLMGQNILRYCTGAERFILT